MSVMFYDLWGLLMDYVVIVSSVRTPLGALNGNFRSVSAVELGSATIRKASEKIQGKVDSVYMGCVLSAGLGQSPARQAALKAGLHHSVNCVNVNKACGSGMAAIMMARNAILAGDAEVVIAGGMESVTNAPYLLDKVRSGYQFGDGELIDHIVRDGLENAYEKCMTGVYAEDSAKAYSITREEQDEYTIQSFLRTRKAIESGWFKNEIAHVVVRGEKSDTVIDVDEIPFSVDISRISSLKPAFKRDGTITAASASPIADGAAAVLMMKESKAVELGLIPLVRIVAQSSVSMSPKLFAITPTGAIKDVLRKSGWGIAMVDMLQITETFAVVVMSVIKEFSIDPNKVNAFGGACALGHPLGASGARVIATLINAMKRKNAKKGLATMCIGGGEGVAMTFERNPIP